MKIVSWNVNGINACTNKGSIELLKKINADIYCFQEVKAQRENIPAIFLDCLAFHSFAIKKGYSGVSIFTRIKPLRVVEKIGIRDIDDEGRIIGLEFKDFFLINVYFPHAHRELKRLDFKLNFNMEFLAFCKRLEKIKPLIIASDFNVAHKEIDLKNPKSNKNNAGFTPNEREWFDKFLKDGFIDTFREFVKEEGNYTWWPYMNNARKRNIGWRIDYFVISSILKNQLINSEILKNYFGSDHCPIMLTLNN